MKRIRISYHAAVHRIAQDRQEFDPVGWEELAPGDPVYIARDIEAPNVAAIIPAAFGVFSVKDTQARTLTRADGSIMEAQAETILKLR